MEEFYIMTSPPLSLTFRSKSQTEDLYSGVDKDVYCQGLTNQNLIYLSGAALLLQNTEFLWVSLYILYIFLGK